MVVAVLGGFPVDGQLESHPVRLARPSSASLVDAAVAVAAERSSRADLVEIPTANVDDLQRLADPLDRPVEVRRV